MTVRKTVHLFQRWVIPCQITQKKTILNPTLSEFNEIWHTCQHGQVGGTIAAAQTVVGLGRTLIIEIDRYGFFGADADISAIHGR